MGKVLIAWADEFEGDPARIGPLTPVTPRTITDLSALRRELEPDATGRVRAQRRGNDPGEPDGRRSHS